jgi:hypothetical protein
MTRSVHASLILVAALATLYAVAAFLARLDTDCYVAVLVAILALGGSVLTDHLAAEFDRRATNHDLHIAHAVHDTWARREEQQ